MQTTRTSKTEKDDEPRIPRFSVEYMDRSVDPRKDFYEYSVGAWLKANPVPADKAVWSAFDELQETNLYLVRRILENSSNNESSSSGGDSKLKRLVVDFYTSAMDTGHIEELGLKPILDSLKRIEAIQTREDLISAVAELKTQNVEPFFTNYSIPDKKNSSIYAYYINQGGLSLPDREYYLADTFSKLRSGYLNHLARMFGFLGETQEERRQELAKVVLDLETDLARASRSRADLRDEEKNYNKIAISELEHRYPLARLSKIVDLMKVSKVDYVIVGQPEFFDHLEVVFSKRALDDLKVYLRWQVIHRYAPFLNSSIEKEDFDFFKHQLLGQEVEEPRWKIVMRVIDELLGEALGKLYVEEHFPLEVSKRAALLVDDLRSIFSKRLINISWMSEPTKELAQRKFEKFTAKIGHPEHFRDYSSIVIDPSDYLGNVKRAATFEVHRLSTRVGKAVDKDEWLMTPPTVNAYFSPTENQIVFPAGILQPPYFDFSLDDAVNFGAIGAVIGHEITHGYDDQGRKFDADGNLKDWWTEDDEKKFQNRAKGVVELYNSQEPLPGARVNGELTLGENIADFGGLSIALEALERRLEQEPSKRKLIDGLTPEQRFFISWAQIWRGNVKEQELRRRLTIDPHSPMKFRAILPAVNHSGFDGAFPPKSDEERTKRTGRLEIW